MLTTASSPLSVPLSDTGTARGSGPLAVGPPNRNGHARVIGRIATLIAAMPSGESVRVRMVCLSRLDEDMLRDADVGQVDDELRALATQSSSGEWRAGLRRYFRRRYDLTVAFDGLRMRIA